MKKHELKESLDDSLLNSLPKGTFSIEDMNEEMNKLNEPSSIEHLYQRVVNRGFMLETGAPKVYNLERKVAIVAASLGFTITTSTPVERIAIMAKLFKDYRYHPLVLIALIYRIRKFVPPAFEITNCLKIRNLKSNVDEVFSIDDKTGEIVAEEDVFCKPFIGDQNLTLLNLVCRKAHTKEEILSELNRICHSDSIYDFFNDLYLLRKNVIEYIEIRPDAIQYPVLDEEGVSKSSGLYVIVLNMLIPVLFSANQ